MVPEVPLNEGNFMTNLLVVSLHEDLEFNSLGGIMIGICELKVMRACAPFDWFSIRRSS
jgi:hypothetical protein